MERPIFRFCIVQPSIQPLPCFEFECLAYLEKEFPNLTIGYSDHSVGSEVPIAAAAMGAELIEKHFTLDNEMEGPDHKASATLIS